MFWRIISHRQVEGGEVSAMSPATFNAGGSPTLYMLNQVVAASPINFNTQVLYFHTEFNIEDGALQS